MSAGIQLHWSIAEDGSRSARSRELTLVVSKPGSRPVKWWLVNLSKPFSEQVLDYGETRVGSRYSSLVRQAMYDAEQALTALEGTR
jgi:hypothetical protein